MKDTIPHAQDAEPLHFDDGPPPERVRELTVSEPAGEQSPDSESRNGDLPEGFLRSHGHIIKSETIFDGRAKTPRTIETFVCSDITLLGKGVNPDGEWGKLIAFKDPLGADRRIVIPFRHLAGDGKDARALMLGSGLITATDKAGRDALAQLLAFGGGDTLYHLADRLGWHHGHFVLPHEIITPPDPKHLVAYDQPAGDHPYRPEGSLAEWQKICEIVQGIPYAVLAIAAAFAGPLLRLLHAESGGIHFFGPSSRGKTTYARLAGSVWAVPDEIVRPWHATINGIEARAADACDTLLILDEVGQSDTRGAASDVAKITYMLANGVGKARATKTGGLQQGSTWRVLTISTGEHPISDMVRDHHGGQRMTGGIGVRMIDLPIHPKAASVSQDEQKPENTGRMLDEARAIISANHGHAGPQFVRHLIADPDTAIAIVEKTISQIMEVFSGENDDPQVSRIARRVALIIAAGKLAEDYGVLTWPSGTSEIAGQKALIAWSEQRGSRSSLEELNAVKTVRRFLEAHGDSRFRSVSEVAEDSYDTSSQGADRAIINRAGFRSTNEDGDPVWYIMPQIWQSDVCLGQDPQFVARTLAKLGILKPGEGNHLAKKVRLPGQASSSRFYVVTAEIFAESTLD